MARVEPSRSRTRVAGSLSHGQKQWLEIGMLLAQDPKLLLVAEPVAAAAYYTAGLGGGIYADMDASASVTNTPLKGNAALRGGGIYVHDDGSLFVGTSTLTGNTALADGGGDGVLRSGDRPRRGPRALRAAHHQQRR